MLRDASQSMAIRGGGTRGLRPPAGGVLDMSGMSGITLYEPGALTLVAQAGTALAEIDAALAAENQRLAFEPPDMCRLLGRNGVSTIGGVVADNASGPRRVQSGACRDSLIGIRMVDGMGTIIKNGGRVMKNVTGYDLVKLMAGSQGRLGVLSEVSFKLQARPEAERTLVAYGRDAGTALAALRQAMGSPYDVSGAAHLDAESGGGTSRTLIRIEGMAGSVAYRAAQLAPLLGDCTQTEGTDSAAHWHALRDVHAFADLPGAVWRLSQTPTRALDVVHALDRAGVSYQVMWDWGGARAWILTGADATEVIARAIAGIGHATLVRSLPGMQGPITLPPEADGIATLTAGLRAAFDPRGILDAAKG
jgi:glycolate oxidase FAD binding subunit